MKLLLSLPPALWLVAGLPLAGCDGRPAPSPPAASAPERPATAPATQAAAAPERTAPSAAPAPPPARPGADTPAPPVPTPPAGTVPSDSRSGPPSAATHAPASSVPRIDDALASRILQARHCSGCHQRDRQVVGPSWRQISDRLAAQPDAAARLRHSIRHGSTGRWGPLSMPPQPQLAPAEADVLLPWILQPHP